MAIAVNSYKQCFAANFNLFKSHFQRNSEVFSVSFRYLRGSRLGRELTSEEIKYQKLIKAFRNESKSIQNEEKILACRETPQPIEKVSLEKVSEKQFKSLEERITPLKQMSYDEQLERKYNKSLLFLQSFGRQLEALKVSITLGKDKLPCPVDFVVPSPLTEEYRNKDEFSIGLGVDGITKTIGFIVPHECETSDMYCESPDNLIITKSIHKSFVKDVEKYVQSSSLPVFSPKRSEGFWKNVIVRSNQQGDMMGILIVHPQQRLLKDEIQEQKAKLREYFSALPKSYNLKSLYFQVCGHSSCSHEQSPYELLFGDASIVEEVNGLELQISPDSYFLSNTKACESMHKALLKVCRVKKSTTVLDVCSGVGPLSLVFASHVKECIGIDPCQQSNTDAIFNANLNAKNNVDFIRGQPESVLKEVLREGFFEDLVVVLNPSKTRINKHLITTMRECRRLKKIVYITTKVSTALDNFVALCKPCGSHHYLGKAFLPILAVPVDLNPHTENFGLMVMFQRL